MSCGELAQFKVRLPTQNPPKFEKRGFTVVAPFGSTRFSKHVLMRKTV